NRRLLNAERAGNRHFMPPPWLEMCKQAVGGHVHDRTQRIIEVIARSPFPGIPAELKLMTRSQNRLVINFSRRAADACRRIAARETAELRELAGYKRITVIDGLLELGADKRRVRAT